MKFPTIYTSSTIVLNLNTITHVNPCALCRTHLLWFPVPPPAILESFKSELDFRF